MKSCLSTQLLNSSSCVLRKCFVFTGLLILFAVPQVNFGESNSGIAIGFTEAEVIEHLGPTIGEIRSPSRVILYYPEGEVHLIDDSVQTISLLSQTEMERRAQLAEKHRAEWLEQQEKQRERRIEQGTALRTDRLASPAFRALPAREQVSFWRNFQITYPEVDASSELQTALALFEATEAEQERQRELQQLRTQLANAEAAAYNARRAAEQAAQRAAEAEQRLRFNAPIYSTSPFIARPPTRTIYITNTHQSSVHRQRGFYQTPNPDRRIHSWTQRAVHTHPGGDRSQHWRDRRATRASISD